MRRPGAAAIALAVTMAVTLAGCDRTLVGPAGCPIPGIDVSRHQGTIDWPRVAAAGVRFAWIKATEGGDYRDPAFRRNWELAEAAGIRRGAYHFVYWCRPAKDQGNWFIANVPDDPDALPPVLDVEWNPGSRSCPGKLAREQALAAVTEILAAMERAYGQPPVVYAPADLYADVLQGAALANPLWVRAVTGRPEERYDRGWAVWQYSDTGRVLGIAGDVDLDCVTAAMSQGDGGNKADAAALFPSH